MLFGLLSYRAAELSTYRDQWVRHTYQVIENLQAVLIATEKIDSSYREFVSTGEESALDDYRSSTMESNQHAAVVLSLTADNPVQREAALALKRLSDQQI